jgi:hypothetical protein
MSPCLPVAYHDEVLTATSHLPHMPARFGIEIHPPLRRRSSARTLRPRRRCRSGHFSFQDCVNVFSRPTAALFLLSLLLTGCPADPADGPVAAGIQAVRLIRVGADETGVTSRRFIGRIEAKSRVDLAFQVEGQIQSIPVREGQVVERGALIAALDPEGFELALVQAEARLALAQAEHDRARELFTRAAVSQSRIDEVSAELKLAEAAVGIARRNLGLTRIEAPFKALITRRLLDPFSFVTSMNPTPVVRVQDVSELRVRLAIPGPLIGLGLIRTASAPWRVWRPIPNQAGRWSRASSSPRPIPWPRPMP